LKFPFVITNDIYHSNGGRKSGAPRWNRSKYGQHMALLGYKMAGGFHQPIDSDYDREVDTY
jgi:hypothetical protein